MKNQCSVIPIKLTLHRVLTANTVGTNLSPTIVKNKKYNRKKSHRLLLKIRPLCITMLRKNVHIMSDTGDSYITYKISLVHHTYENEI